MAYDEKLAVRIRTLLQSQPDVSEKKMFGGLAFLVAGHMAIAASGQGGILVRVGSESFVRLAAQADVEVARMRGRDMRGWLRVGASALTTRRKLERWVNLSVSHVRSLPAKQPRTRTG